MNQDLKIIKKKYGENMAKLCRTLFPTLLENKWLLSNLLLDSFEPDRSLYEDITDQGIENEFKNYIYNFIDVENNNEIKVNKTPEELLGEAGYDLYECKTEEDIQSFKKYYAKGEELCTFYGGRLDRCIVFFAVKKDVDNIKREDYPNPRRQDLYGTSVISIQFERNSSHTLSIKNRYNHRVNNPDSTFSNDLDNIIPGLTKSFEDSYGLVQSHKSKGFEILGYVKAQDGKYYKYNYEMNNIYYCTNNVIIDNFEVKRYPKDKYLVFDYFILDLENKQIYLYDEKLNDPFTDTINDIEKIEINKKENKKIVKMKCLNQEDIKITLNKDNQILELSNPNIQQVGDYFLEYNETLEMIDFPKLAEVGNSFLEYNEILQTINLPKLQKVGHQFLYNNQCLKILDFPNLKEAGNCFLSKNTILETINCPKLQKIGEFFLCFSENLQVIDFPNLTEIGQYFLMCNESLEELNCPNIDINTLDYSFMESHPIFNGKNIKNRISSYEQKKLVLKM